MTLGKFVASEWAVVLPKPGNGILASPFLMPATIETRETGHVLSECCGCGQFREDVRCADVEVVTRSGGREVALIEVCGDCREAVGD